MRSVACGMGMMEMGVEEVRNGTVRQVHTGER